MRHKHALVALLIASTAAAQAPRWEQIGTVRGSGFYMDRSTVVRAGDEVRVWVNFRLPEPQRRGDATYTAIQALWVIQCHARRFAALAQNYYDPSGLRVGADGPIPAEPIPPDSTAELVLSLLCR